MSLSTVPEKKQQLLFKPIGSSCLLRVQHRFNVSPLNLRRQQKTVGRRMSPFPTRTMSPSPSPRSHRAPAFTLIELLVVIAIIAILAAILFSRVCPRPCANARRASCQSNLKQIGLGFEQYKNDYDQFYPGSVVNNISWSTLIDPYLKSEQIFVCPSSSEQVRAPSNILRRQRRIIASARWLHLLAVWRRTLRQKRRR